MQNVFDRMKIDKLSLGVDIAATKNRVIAENIANMDTPGYKAKDIKFDNVMQEALGNGKKLPLERTNEKHIPPSATSINPAAFIYDQNNPSVRNDGNDVNIDYEMSQMAENTIRYNLFSDLTAGKFSKLKEVIGNVK
ncbi:MAG: flagellar basal body rod protein FlgB [Denitrovibrio sp.]|nr:MAG: flagellar basal body rod protein FlgB [Denitrovibrio sp.]